MPGSKRDTGDIWLTPLVLVCAKIERVPRRRFRNVQSPDGGCTFFIRSDDICIGIVVRLGSRARCDFAE